MNTPVTIDELPPPSVMQAVNIIEFWFAQQNIKSWALGGIQSRTHGIAQESQQEAVKVKLFDSQWVNVVNHDNAYRDWDKTDAINHAVNMTERLIAENVAKDSSPHCKTTPLNIQQFIANHDITCNLLAEVAHAERDKLQALIAEIAYLRTVSTAKSVMTNDGSREYAYLVDDINAILDKYIGVKQKR